MPSKCDCSDCAHARNVAIGYTILFVVSGAVCTGIFAGADGATMNATWALISFYVAGSILLGATWLGFRTHYYFKERQVMYYGTWGFFGALLGGLLGMFIAPYVFYKKVCTPWLRNSCISEHNQKSGRVNQSTEPVSPPPAMNNAQFLNMIQHEIDRDNADKA